MTKLPNLASLGPIKRVTATDEAAHITGGSIRRVTGEPITARVLSEADVRRIVAREFRTLSRRRLGR